MLIYKFSSNLFKLFRCIKLAQYIKLVGAKHSQQYIILEFMNL